MDNSTVTHLSESHGEDGGVSLSQGRGQQIGSGLDSTQSALCEVRIYLVGNVNLLGDMRNSPMT